MNERITEPEQPTNLKISEATDRLLNSSARTEGVSEIGEFEKGPRTNPAEEVTLTEETEYQDEFAYVERCEMEAAILYEEAPPLSFLTIIAFTSDLGPRFFEN